MAPIIGDPANHDISSFQTGMKGSCLCGNITIRIQQAELFQKPNGHICHCYNCRRFSGSSHVNLLCLPTANFDLSDPKTYLKTYMDNDTGSGNAVPRSFCSNCGSSVGCFPVPGMPELSMLALGLFPRIPEPEFEVFTSHRQSWANPVNEKADQYGFADEFARYVPAILAQPTSRDEKNSPT